MKEIIPTYPNKQTWWRVDAKQGPLTGWQQGVYTDHIKSVAYALAKEWLASGYYSEVRIIRCVEYFEHQEEGS